MSQVSCNAYPLKSLAIHIMESESFGVLCEQPAYEDLWIFSMFSPWRAARRTSIDGRQTIRSKLSECHSPPEDRQEWGVRKPLRKFSKEVYPLIKRYSASPLLLAKQ